MVILYPLPYQETLKGHIFDEGVVYPFFERTEGRLEMYLKWFPSKEVAEAAIAEAMQKLSEAQGELNVAEEKKEKAFVVDHKAIYDYYIPPSGIFPWQVSPPVVEVETVKCGPYDPFDPFADAPKPEPNPVPTPEECAAPCVAPPYIRYRLVPRKDITAYEIATIFSAWAADEFVVSQKVYDSLDYNAQRHFKLKE